jgi:Asp-tRNA(Asn)/Glu-tRNA(Gln) amidotransferase C subunit
MPNPIEFDRLTLQHLAELARLHLTADRQPLVRQRLQRLVEAFGALAEQPDPVADADREGRPDPGSDPGEAATLSLRPDLPLPPLRPEQALANAPKQAAGAFLVPRVVDA